MVYNPIMIKQDQQEFKKLVKEGVIETLKSSEGQDAIVTAMSSSRGQDAIVTAMSSSRGQDAIKKGALLGLKSEEGEETIGQYLVNYFHGVVEPVLDDISHDIKTLKTDVRYMKDNHGNRIERLERKMGVAT